MKISAGIYKGKRLISPKSIKTRPTAAKTKEAIFDILNHANWSKGVENAYALDVYAGSGALGLEALSHQAEFCLFIDRMPQAIDIIRQNIHALNLFDKTRIYHRDALSMGNRNSALKPFDLVFIDPPYYQNFVLKTLDLLYKKNWLAPEAICVVETGFDELSECLDLQKENPNSASQLNSFSLQNFHLLDRRIYGSAAVWFLKVKQKS